MKTARKFKPTLANDIEKEANWLTEMSAKGLHFFKYSWGFYYFEEDPNRAYVYQTDFQEADDEYFALYAEAGWEHIQTEIGSYHYFRADRNEIGDKRIYSDPTSVKSMYKRMLLFYSTIFLCILVAQTGLLMSWENSWFHFIALGFVAVVVILYVYLLFGLIRKIGKSENPA